MTNITLTVRHLVPILARPAMFMVTQKPLVCTLSPLLFRRRRRRPLVTILFGGPWKLPPLLLFLPLSTQRLWRHSLLQMASPPKRPLNRRLNRRFVRAIHRAAGAAAAAATSPHRLAGPTLPPAAAGRLGQPGALHWPPALLRLRLLLPRGRARFPSHHPQAVKAYRVVQISSQIPPLFLLIFRTSSSIIPLLRFGRITILPSIRYWISIVMAVLVSANYHSYQSRANTRTSKSTVLIRPLVPITRVLGTPFLRAPEH